MLAGIYRRFRQIGFEDYKLWKLKANDLLIEVGSCETDLNIVNGVGNALLSGLPEHSTAIAWKLQSFFQKVLSIKSSILNPFTFQMVIDLFVSDKISVKQFNPLQVSFRNQELVSVFNNSINNSVVKYMVAPNN